MYRYYIAFSHKKAGTRRIDAVDVTRSAPIASPADLDDVLTALRREGFARPIVVSFSRFDSDSDHAPAVAT